MQFLASFFSAFCAACIFIGALHIICPEGNMKKPIKYVLSLVFLVVIITAAKIPIKNVEIDLATETYSPQSYETMQITAAEYVYSYTLKQQSINFSKITVCTDKSDKESINISKVIIYSNCEKQKIIKALGVLAKVREVEIINE